MGSPRPLFCIGGEEAYVGLSEALAPCLPVHAIYLPLGQTPRGPVRHLRGDMAPSVQQMASGYLEAMRRQQRKGPYRLLGFSFAAVLAFETAQQLFRLGETVDVLVMLDVFLPAPYVADGRPQRSRGSRGSERASPPNRRFSRARRIAIGARS